MPQYIPKLATIEQSCKWMSERLGGVWILPRLLECYLKPYFWIDYTPGLTQIFGDRVEGYLTHMVFHGDVVRLEADGTNALVNMITAHDGSLVKIEPGWSVPLSELRFKREALERVASILEGEALREKSATSGAPEKAALPLLPNDWRESARAIADECFDNDTRNKCRDSLLGYSSRVTDEMQRRNIHGPRGLIDNPKTIQREALQGVKWWKGKTK